MLTLKQIMKVGRLLDQTGGAKGFLEDHNQPSNQSALRDIANAHKHGDGVPVENSVRISIDYEEDPQTGDVRLVSKPIKD